MNLRQRKKLRVAEFQQLVFRIHWTNRHELSESELNAQFDDFIISIEARGLLFGGVFPTTGGDGIVMSAKHDKTTEEDREAVGIWLRNRKDIFAVDVGELVDAWYGWDD